MISEIQKKMALCLNWQKSKLYLVSVWNGRRADISWWVVELTEECAPPGEYFNWQSRCHLVSIWIDRRVCTSWWVFELVEKQTLVQYTNWQMSMWVFESTEESSPPGEYLNWQRSVLLLVSIWTDKRAGTSWWIFELTIEQASPWLW